MAQSVDTKIVELKFNNDNFADKINSTLTKLEQLDEDLKTVGAKDAFKNLNKQLKDVDISNVSKGVEEASKGFSKMEIAGITALANISNAAVNLGKKLVSNLVSPLTKGIMQGGLSRARNIEQATFSFEGQKIGKSAGNEGLSYYKEVMDAVLGTSYSYDVAAKAASQFAASNIGVIETTKKLADGSKQVVKTLDPGSGSRQSSMTSALLGVAGVASMTGRSFDDVSRVFTKIAGNNRVYAQDLQSFSAMGLNAAAVLATSMGKTEEEIYEMVKKGEIHFKEFSDAMNQAFGQHAKDSTLMFQGALDDVNAALARIGADFYGPALNAGRDILNSITPVVDAIHNKLQPALDGTGNIMDKASKSLSQYLDMFAYLLEMYPKMDRTQMGDWIKEHMNSWTNIADLYKRGDISKAVKELQTYSKTFRNMEGKKGIDAYQMLGDYLNVGTNGDLLSHYLDKTDKQIAKITKEGKIGVEDLHTVIDGMIKDGTIGFNTFYKSFHKLWSESDDLMSIATINDDFTDYVRTCIRAEEPSERFNKHLKTFASILNGTTSLIKSFATILGGLADIFLTIASHLKPLGNLLVQAAKDTANFVIEIADFVATSEGFSKIIDGVVHVINKFFELLHISKLAQAALFGISKVFEFLSKVIETVQNGIAKVVSTVSKIFGTIVDKIHSVISDSEELIKILQALKQAGIVVAIINIIDMLTKPARLLSEFGKSIKNVSDSFGGMIKKIGDVFSSISKLVGKIGKVLDELTNALKRLQELIVATAILEIAFAILALAGAIYVLSKVNAAGASDNATAMAEVFALLLGVVGSMKVLSGLTKKSKIWEKSVDSIKGIALAMVAMSAAIAILAGSIYLLSKIDTDKMVISFAVIETLMLTMAGIAKFLSVTTTKSTGLKALWSGEKTSTGITKGLLGLVAIAEAVKIVAKAITEVATISDPTAMWNAVAVVEALMWSMAAITKWLSGTETTKMTKGVASILAIALAIKLLTKPITELSMLASSDNDSLWSAVGAVFVLVTVMSLLMKMLSGSKGLVKAGVGLLIMAESIRILGDVVIAFSSLNAETMWQSIKGIAVALGAITLSLALVDEDGVLKKAAAFIIIAAALKVLSGVILDFGTNNDAAWAGIGVAVMSLMLLIGALYAFKKVPLGGILKAFLTLALGAVLIAGFGAAIGVLGVGIGMFGIGLGILAAGAKQAGEVMGPLIMIIGLFILTMAGLMAIGLPAIGVLLGISVAFLLLGAGMMMIGTGLSDMAAAIKVLNELKGNLKGVVKEITEFIKSLKSMSKDAEGIGESFQTISKPLASIKKSAETITEQIDKLVSSYTDLVSQSSGCITALSDSLTSISKLNKDSFASATTAIKDFINSLAGMKTDAEPIAETATSVSNSLEEMKGAFDVVVGAIGTFKSLSYQTFTDLGEALSSITNPITTLYNLKNGFDDISAKLQEFVDSLKKMKDDAAVVSEGATAISDSLQEVGDAAASAKDSFTGLTQATADILTQMGAGLESMGKGIKVITKSSDGLDAAAKSIKKFYNKLSDLNSISEGIASGTRTVAGAIKALGKAAEKTAALSKSGMTTSGEKMVDGLVKGIENKKEAIKTKTETVVNAAETKVKKNRKDWYDIGSYLIKGMIEGIADQQSNLEAQVKALEDKAERAVEAKAKIKSPSRVWMKIGAYMGEGLAIGISNSAHQVQTASIGLANTSESAIESAIASISEAMTDDFDLNPTITPVVDLSNIRRGAGLANSAFSSSLLSVNGKGLAASITHNIQNGSKNDVGKSLNNLTKQLGDMTESMNSRSLNVYNTIDGSSDPSLFADELVRSFKLNARTI